ncbi:MAG: phosphate regulon sensor histidine kinase PhoR [Gammaproteobacteria bacterium]|nr:phosphate regulon sensor histidine kinase PhoR [Gammaproteobacteria bacterium]
MSDAARKFLLGLLLFLVAAAGVGWFYDRLAWGLLVAALAALGWHVYRLLAFERALRTDDFGPFRYGEGIWEQIFARHRFERERGSRRKKEYRSLLKEIRKSTNAMPDGAVILDANDDIVACNRASKELAGLKRKKDRGQRVDNIIRDPELTRLLKGDDAKASVEIRSPVHDGAWLSCRVVPYGGDQKLLLLRDITERKRLSKMRRDFVANASHELRSPLTVISGYLDSLADDEAMPETWRQPVRQMRGQASRMRQLLGELLELSRLESAGPSKTEEPVDVMALVRSSCEALGGHANVANITVNEESTGRLRGNAAEIETVIINLLSNAIRYTPADGDITITWRSDADGAELLVADTGEGIDPESIPRLTERFFRVDKGRSRDDGGIGLGLAIVKHILARHDAELVVTSDAGVGSEFCCRFPVERLVTAESVTVS